MQWHWRLAGMALLILVAATATAEDEEARRDRLQNLSAAEQEELRRKRDSFTSLDQSEQVRMRELHVSISTSPNSDRLQGVMLRYHQWLKTLTGKQRADLLNLPADERLDAIKRLMDEQRHQRFRDLVRTPPAAEDIRAIFGWLDKYAASHEDELLALLPDPMRQRVTGKHVPPAMRRKMLLMALGSRDVHVQLPAPTDEDIQKLNENLSDNAKEALAKVPSREQKLQLVREWMRAAVASRLTPQVSRERLLAFYRDYREQTTDKKRIEQLDSLPPDKFYEEIKRIYFRSRGHWRGRREGDHRHAPGASDRPAPPTDGPRDRPRGGPHGRSGGGPRER